ncbi:hypothetical protein EK21DRAFT_116510 [Setomelanomma holmii]|uniref:Uncharacterized protein n=1 Tax=Setomelanomma holmii TaxID=210430 RepID=A0A9P4H247_9PLEO|nr:hypothetical protein EK21DRAFT_116510 [Setomelanomma holmii]
MQVKTLFLTAATVAVDFIVITDYPSAIATLNAQQQASYLSSILPGIRSELLQPATDTSYVAQATSVVPQLRDFVATAAVSVPPVVTATDDFQIYTTVPSWYSQLPSGVRALYDQVGQRVESFLDENQPTLVPNGTISASATPTSSLNSSATSNVTIPATTPSGSSPPESTGKAARM